jgi:hypothetical protein
MRRRRSRKICATGAMSAASGPSLLRRIYSEALTWDKAPADAEFIACPEAVVIGWIRFDNQRVAERILKRPGDKRRLPDRDELLRKEPTSSVMIGRAWFFRYAEHSLPTASFPPTDPETNVTNAPLLSIIGR